MLYDFMLSSVLSTNPPHKGVWYHHIYLRQTLAIERAY